MNTTTATPIDTFTRIETGTTKVHVPTVPARRDSYVEVPATFLVETNVYAHTKTGEAVVLRRYIANDRTEAGRAAIEAFRASTAPKAETPAVGDRVEVTGTVVYHTSDTYMNTTTHFIILKDETGASWKLNTTADFMLHVKGFRPELGWAKGNTLTMKATVKMVGEYKGTPSYTINRPKLIAFTLGAAALATREGMIKDRDSHPCLAHRVEENKVEYATATYAAECADLDAKMRRYQEHERFNCPTHRTATIEYPISGTTK